MKNKGRKDIKSERNFPPRHSHGFIVSVIDSYEYHAFIIKNKRENSWRKLSVPVIKRNREEQKRNGEKE